MHTEHNNDWPALSRPCFEPPVIAFVDPARWRHHQLLAAGTDLAKRGAVLTSATVKARHRFFLHFVAVSEAINLGVEREALFEPEFPNKRLLVAHQRVMPRILQVVGMRLCVQYPRQRLPTRPGSDR